MQSCGMSIIKYLIFAFNFLFLLSGIAVITVGALIDSDYTEYAAFIPPSLSSAPILLIVIGCIIFVIAFFGCCGAWKENYCMTLTFSLLLTMIFVLEVAAGVTAFVSQDSFSDDLYSSMNDTLNEALKNDGSSDSKSSLTSWQSMQKSLQCCGISNFTDWETPSGKPYLPGLDGCACIQTSSQFSLSNPTNVFYWDSGLCGNFEIANLGSPIYKTGCYNKISDFINDNLLIVGAVGVGIAVLQILGIICACCLASSIKDEH